MRCLLLVVLAVLGLAGPLQAQVATVTAGEHADFTRVVIRVQPADAWDLSGEGTDRRLRLANDRTRFNLQALFDRIPRTRLVSARDSGPELLLSLACACPIRAWEERPGLIVIDIADPAPSAPIEVPEPRDALLLARRVGEALARTMPEQSAPTTEPSATGLDPGQRAALTADLGTSVAIALSQGLLDHPVADAGPQTGLLDGSPMPNLPENMRIQSALDRTEATSAPASEPTTDCRGTELLHELLDLEFGSYNAEVSAVVQRLYGEFDQPDPGAQSALILLSLASGLGAEARMMIDNATEPLAGRDFALGLSDVLEDRRSNSRMRLASAIDCGGVTSLAAVLAGADRARIPRHGHGIALTFTQLPATLRAVIGTDLVEALILAEAIDAARIIADSVIDSVWASPEDISRLRAMLARSRGDLSSASRHLEQVIGPDLSTLQARLDIALQASQPLPDGMLDDAESAAATGRNDEAGPEVMARIIRLRARNPNPADAFAALDRLETWLADTPENRRFIGNLRDEVWSRLATNTDPAALIEAVLARSDWRGEDLAPATRRALAARLVDYGFAQSALTLITDDLTPEGQILQARGALAMGDPETALSLVVPSQDRDAIELRAAAYRAMGDSAAAAAELAQLGEVDAALHDAILAGNWRLVEQLRARLSRADDRSPALADLLGRAPGHAEILESIAVAGGGLPGQSPDMGPTSVAPNATTDESTGAEALPVPEPDPQIPSPMDAPPESALTRDPAPTLSPRSPPATATETPPELDPEAILDRMGMVRRSTTLMSESARLRDAVAALVDARGN